jgi:hypothetical protein
VDVVQHSEMVEAEITRLIERRHDARVAEEGERRAEEIWMESERKHQERERRQLRWEWVRYFDRMAKNHRQLSQDYERRAEELCEEGEK